MQCVQCGAQLPDDSAICSQCGAEVTPLGQSPDEASREIYALLASANLARIRKEYEQATARCIEIMRRFPNNASAHSLMGDIYADQGLLRDAAEWFRIAIELDPASRADRTKLDTIMARLRSGPAVAESVETGLARALRALGVSRPVAIGMGITLVMLLALLIAAVTYQRVMLGTSARSRTSQSVPLARPSGGAGRLPGAAGPPASQRSPRQPPQQAPAASSAEDRTLSVLRVAAATASPGVLVEWAALDPRDYSLTVAFQVPRQDTVAEAKRAVLRAAAELARAAFRHDAAITSAVIRGRTIFPQATQGPPELVFVGETQPSKAGALPPANPSLSEIQGILTNVWWHPLLRDVNV